MCWNRATSALCRTMFADVLHGGAYTPEELGDDRPPATTVQAGPAEVDTVTGEVLPLAGQTQDHDLWADDMPTAWAIDNIRDAEDAKWLLQQPETDDAYREAVKAIIGAAGLHWPAFWKTGNANEWRSALRQAHHQLSGAGSSDRPPDAPGDVASALGSPAPGPMSGAETLPTSRPTADRRAREHPAANRAPDPKDTSGSVGERPTKTASPTEPEVANQSKPGARETPPSPDATPAPEPSSPRGSGATQRSGRGGSGRDEGKRPNPAADSPAGTDEVEQAAFEQTQADPGRFTR
jgi:hypothetical protein